MVWLATSPGRLNAAKNTATTSTGTVIHQNSTKSKYSVAGSLPKLGSLNQAANAITMANNAKVTNTFLRTASLTAKPAWASFTIPHDVQEQLLQRRGRMTDLLDLAAVPGDDVLDLFLGFLAESASPNLGHLLDPQQVGHSAQLPQFALVQDGNAIANVLHVGRKMAAQHHVFAVVVA